MPDSRKDHSRKATIITLMTITLLFFTGYSVFLVSNVTTDKIELSVVGEDMKIIGPGETAKYPIKIENKGPVDARVTLESFNTPDGWEAELSSDEEWIDGKDTGMVFLSVTAPSTPSKSMVRVAEIGVRAGGNVTIGTITILKGTATLTRDGVESNLDTGDEIKSGDWVETSGESVIALDPNILKNVSGGDEYTGTIYVLLSDAEIGFMRKGDTAYMIYLSGEVTIWVPGGGGGRRSRGPSGLPMVNLSQLDLIDEEFPDHEYQGFLEFGDLTQHSFFHLDVNEEETTVEVFDGEVVVGSDVGNRSVEKFEQATVVRTEDVPEPEPVERTIITLESDDSVDGTIESLGANILDLPDVHHLPMDDFELYVTPRLPEITLDLDGKKTGEYSIEIMDIEDFTTKQFTVRSTATENTTDDLTYEDEELKFSNMEEDKTYDVIIVYENASSGEKSEFTVNDVKTSGDEQSIAVDDWEKLDEAEEKPVSFKEGDKEVKVKEGTTGDEIEELLTEDEEKAFPWFWVSLGLVVLIGAAISFTETGKIRFILSTMALVTRVTEEDIEKDIREQNIRGMIYQHIQENPGTRYNAIQKSVMVSNGTVCYHLDVLKKREYIRSKPVMGKMYYWSTDLIFPDKKRYPQHKYPPLDEDQEEIIQALQAGPSLSAKELSLQTAIPGATLYRKLQKMTIFGMVSKEWGLPSRYTLNNEYEKHYIEYETKIKDGEL